MSVGITDVGRLLLRFSCRSLNVGVYNDETVVT